jgi:uncharacterized coiled-coil protein SlyX
LSQNEPISELDAQEMPPHLDLLTKLERPEFPEEEPRVRQKKKKNSRNKAKTQSNSLHIQLYPDSKHGSDQPSSSTISPSDTTDGMNQYFTDQTNIDSLPMAGIMTNESDKLKETALFLLEEHLIQKGRQTMEDLASFTKTWDVDLKQALEQSGELENTLVHDKLKRFQLTKMTFAASAKSDEFTQTVTSQEKTIKEQRDKIEHLEQKLREAEEQLQEKQRHVEENQVDNGFCVFCQQDMMNPEVTATLPCGHQFHSQCLQPWVKQKKAQICPICQKPVEEFPPLR